MKANQIVGPLAITRLPAEVVAAAADMLQSCDYVGVTDGRGEVTVKGYGLTPMDSEVCYSTIIAERGFEDSVSFATPKNEVEVQYVD